MLSKKQKEEAHKICPNCGHLNPKTSRKCSECAIFYAQFLRQNAERNEEGSLRSDKSWSTNELHKHVESHHPEGAHSVKTMNPMLSNPNSKFNILALTKHLKDTAGIEKKDSQNGFQERQWCYVAADAAISVQVVH